MPLRIPAGDGLATFVLGISGDADPMYTTLGVRAVLAPLGQSHAERLLDAFRDNIMPQLSSVASLSAVILRVRDDAGSDILYEARPSPAVAGSGAATALPQNVAYVIRKNTSRAGRRGRGRMYIPGVPESAVNEVGQVVSGTQTIINTALSTFFTHLTATGEAGPPAEEGVLPLLFHDNTSVTTVDRSPGQVVRTITEGAQGPLPDLVTGFTLDPRVGTQRRRLR